MSEFNDAVISWVDTMNTAAELGQRASSEQWTQPGPCPGWSVGDLVAHLSDIELVLLGDARPDHSPQWTQLPHAQSDFQRFTEIGVDLRRTWSQQEVLDELRQVTGRRHEQLLTGPHDLDTQVMGLRGNPTPLRRLLAMRTFDAWVHCQDIRQVLHDDQGWDSAAARSTRALLVHGVQLGWAQLLDDADATATVILVDIDERFIAGSGSTKVVMQCTWPQFMAGACGRVSSTDLTWRAQVDTNGPQPLIEKLLAGMAITP